MVLSSGELFSLLQSSPYVERIQFTRVQATIEDFKSLNSSSGPVFNYRGFSISQFHSLSDFFRANLPFQFNRARLIFDPKDFIPMSTIYTLSETHYHHLKPRIRFPPTTTQPTSVPSLVYRVHRASAQTRYAFSTGFFAKNQTTILNYTSRLSHFGLAHLTCQTNISSPFVSVYDNRAHAEAVAKYFAQKYGQDTWVVTVDTRYFARGPVFRAADLLKGVERELGGRNVKEGGGERECEWLHYGEYLIMYRIPPQAIRDQTPVARGSEQTWKTVGVIGRKVGKK